MSDLTPIKEAEIEHEKAIHNFKGGKKESPCDEHLPFTGKKYNFTLFEDEQYEENSAEKTWHPIRATAECKIKSETPANSNISKLKISDGVIAEYSTVNCDMPKSENQSEDQSNEYSYKTKSIDKLVDKITGDCKTSTQWNEYPILKLKRKPKTECMPGSEDSVKNKIPKLKATDEVHAENLVIGLDKKDGLIKIPTDECPNKLERFHKLAETTADYDKNSGQFVEYPMLKLKRQPNIECMPASDSAVQHKFRETDMNQDIRVGMQWTQNDQNAPTSISVKDVSSSLMEAAKNVVSDTDQSEALSTTYLEKLKLLAHLESISNVKDIYKTGSQTSQSNKSATEFGLQKSNSLIDLKSMRLRNSKLHNVVPGPTETTNDIAGSCLALDILQQQPIKFLFQRGFQTSNNSSDPGIKFYTLLMLNNWRKQRLEVEKMKEEIEEMKQKFNNTRNQIYVLNNLYRIEMKCNTDMQAHLNIVLESVRENKCIAKTLTQRCDLDLVAKSMLNENLQSKNIKIQGLNETLIEVKNKLFVCSRFTEELQMLVTEEQNKAVNLKSKIDELVVDITELKRNNNVKLSKIKKKIMDQEAAIIEKKLKIEVAKATSELVKEAHEEFSDCEEIAAQWRLQVQELREKVASLQTEIEANRLLNWVKNLFICIINPETKVAQAIHTILYLLLPAVPPPKSIALPYGFSVGKSLSFVKHK